MDTVTSIASAASVIANSVPKPTAPAPAPDRALAQAVNQLNQSGFAGEDREVTISLDPGTRQPVVKVVDVNTGEILHQWPSQYVLQIAEDSKSQNK